MLVDGYGKKMIEGGGKKVIGDEYLDSTFLYIRRET